MVMPKLLSRFGKPARYYGGKHAQNLTGRNPDKPVKSNVSPGGGIPNSWQLSCAIPRHVTYSGKSV